MHHYLEQITNSSGFEHICYNVSNNGNVIISLNTCYSSFCECKCTVKSLGLILDTSNKVDSF